MANISYYELSKKTYDNGQKEVIIGIFISQSNKFRIKTGIKVDPKSFHGKAKDGKIANLSNRYNSYEITIPKTGKLNYLEVKDLQDQRDGLKSYCSIIDRIITKTQEKDKDRLSKEYVMNAKRLIDIYGTQFEDITYNKILELEEKERVETEKKIEEELKELEKLPFFDLLNEYRNNSKKKVNGVRDGDKSDVWKKNFDVLVRALKRYEWFIKLSKNRTFSLDIDTITKDTLSSFASFLREEYQLLEKYPKIFEKIPATTDKRRNPKPQPRGDHAIDALFNKLRAFISWCIEEEKTTNNPLKGFYGVKRAKYDTRPVYISLEERNKIADFDLSGNPSLETQRDIFIFQCCVGCRVSDLMKLKSENIIKNENGKDKLVYTPQKTEDSNNKGVSVPLNPRAKGLVKKYYGVDKEGRLFPFISPQKYNEAIKEIFEVCGITREVSVYDPLTGKTKIRPINEVASSHMARRCFVGNLYKKSKDPALIASMSGHSEQSRSFSRYRDIDDEDKEEVVNLIN